MIPIEHKIVLNTTLDGSELFTNISIKQNDGNSHKFIFEGLSDVVFDSALLKFYFSDKSVYATSAVNIVDNAIEFILTAGAVSVAGNTKAEISLYFENGRVTSNTFDFLIESEIDTSDVTSDSKWPVIDEKILEVQELHTQAGNLINEIGDINDKIIKSADIINDDLIIILNDDTEINAGTIKGEKGDTGVSVSSITIDANNHLKITYSNGNIQDAGLIDSYTQAQITTFLSNKVDKVTGKGLSTNDYDNTDKAKVDKIITNGSGTKYLMDDGNYKSIADNSLTLSKLQETITISGKNLLNYKKSNVTNLPYANTTIAAETFLGYDVFLGVSYDADATRTSSYVFNYSYSDMGFTFTTATTANYGVGFKIPAKPSTSYVAKCTITGTTRNVGLFAFDVNGNKLTTSTPSSNQATLTTPSNTAYLLVVIAPNVLGTYTISDLQLELGTTPTAYVDYTSPIVKLDGNYVSGMPTNNYTDADKAKVDKLVTNGDGNQCLLNNGTYGSIPITDGSLTLKALSESIITYGKNLFNKAMVTNGKYVHPTSGTLYSNANYCTTDFIPIKPNTTYTTSKNGVLSGYAKMYYGTFFKSDKTTVISGSGWSTAIQKITSPNDSNAAYVRFSILLSDGLDGYQFEEGSTPTSYVDYTAPITKLKGEYVYGVLTEEVVTDLEDKIEVLKPVVKIDLADSYDIVAGETFELFMKGIIHCRDYNQYYVVANALYNGVTRGSKFKRKWVYTPDISHAGQSFTLKLSVYDNNNTLLDEKQTTINVLSPTVSSPATTKNVVLVGDSLTYAAVYPAELKRRLTGTGGTPTALGLSNINFVGNVQLSSGGITVNTEAKSGASWTNFISSGTIMYWVDVISGEKLSTESEQSVWIDSNNNTWVLETRDTVNHKIKFKFPTGQSGYTMPTSGTLTFVSGSGDTADIVYQNATAEAGNAFWNANKTGGAGLDFINYCTNLGISQIDYIVTLLSWNSYYKSMATIETEAKTFFNAVHADFPNCKIILMGIQIGSEDGYGTSYGTETRFNSMALDNYVHNLNNLFQAIANEEGYSDFIEFVQVSGQFDTEYNMQSAEYNVNTRNTTKETRQNNGVHPASTGYLQIADACYRKFIKLLSSV